MLYNKVTFRVDEASPTPLFRQVAEVIRDAILDGRLGVGDRLPTVRDLADLAGISHVTAFRAYEELRSAKFVRSYGRKGLRVAATQRRDLVKEQLARVVEGEPIAEFEVKAGAAGIRSLATSVSDVRLFRDDEFLPHLTPTGRRGPWLFYFSEAAGLLSLRTSIAELLTADGLDSSPGDILVTSGSMDAIARLAKGSVLVQAPARLGLRTLLEGQGSSIYPVRTAGGIVDLDHAEAVRSSTGSKLMVCTPDFGHATGESMPLPARRDLVAWANARGVTLIEDASCRALRLHGEPMPSLASMDHSVAQVGSLSYTLAPGLRCGYVRMPFSLATNLLSAAEAIGNPVPSVIQQSTASFIQQGGLRKHLARVLPKYRERRRAMFSALSELPDSVEMTDALGGFSTWCTLPTSRSTELFQRCLSHGVAIAPGQLFCVAGDAGRHFRLSYGSQDAAAITQSVNTVVQILISMLRE